MLMGYIEDNLKVLRNNPESILFIKPYDVGIKCALFAVVKEENGIYKKIQITEKQSKITFPSDPLLWLCGGPNFICLKDYIILNQNNIIINKNNIEGFKSIKLGGVIDNTGIFAVFYDGSANLVGREVTETFKKLGGINNYMNLLDKDNEYISSNKTWEIIDWYDDGTEIIKIPKLINSNQVDEEKGPVKTLGSKPSSNK